MSLVRLAMSNPPCGDNHRRISWGGLLYLVSNLGPGTFSRCADVQRGIIITEVSDAGVRRRDGGNKSDMLLMMSISVELTNIFHPWFPLLEIGSSGLAV